MSVRIEDYDKWLNKPCPLCGENLLKQEDYDRVQNIIKLSNFLNKFPCKNKKNKKETKILFQFGKDKK